MPDSHHTSTRPGTRASTLNSQKIAALVADLSASSGDTATVIAPFTGEVLHELPLSSTRDVLDAYSSARAAQLAWRATSHSHRRAILLKAHDLLLARADELLDIVQYETGKARGHAFEEVFVGASTARYCALAARGVLATRRRRAGIPLVMQTRVSYRPKGVIGIITPWNYPLALALMDVVPALAAGNAVVQKADDQGVLSILAARGAFLDAGLPAALWSIVAGPGDPVGDAVVDGADYVCFTGSTPTGTQVGVRAARGLRGASLELGGKNPLIVLADADPVAAAHNSVYACFASLGQLCVSIERIYVDRSIVEPFTAAFVKRVNSLTAGPAFDFSTDVGSLTTRAQLERVQAHVDDAVAKGASLLAGGHARPDLGPLFFEPTVLTGVTESMDCFAGETFGPVVAITPVDSEAQAIRAANDTAFGLNASVFSSSRRHARRVAGQLDAGSVNINEGYRASFSSVDAPMGGMKRSGLGRRNGREGILRFVDARTVSESTGLMTLPRTGAEFTRLSPLMTLALKVLAAVRRR